jgi:GNAT superfamily N-acetyltransferase
MSAGMSATPSRAGGIRSTTTAVSRCWTTCGSSRGCAGAAWARLLGAALAQIEKAGARAAVVEADPADAPAMAFYRRLGFAPKARRSS